MRENRYQGDLISVLKQTFPFALVIKNDPTYIQGIPDILILQDSRWAALEVKASVKAPHRPNQEYYVELMNGMSFAAVIFPENEERILDALIKFLED